MMLLAAVKTGMLALVNLTAKSVVVARRFYPEGTSLLVQ
jgi:hypothetical protein